MINKKDNHIEWIDISDKIVKEWNINEKKDQNK